MSVGGSVVNDGWLLSAITQKAKSDLSEASNCVEPGGGFVTGLLCKPFSKHPLQCLKIGLAGSQDGHLVESDDPAEVV